MNTLFINMAWDAAGCSFKQAEAINLHTNWKARHFRAVKTFYDTLDIGPENYNKEEFMQLIREADILHFCSATHTYNSPHNFGFDWSELTKDKVKIFHDYNSFIGRWSERAEAKDIWNKREEIGYDAIFSSIPQATLIYKDCVYIPDVVNCDSEEYSYSNINRKEVIIGHFPTGDPNNKNTNELLAAINQVKTQGKNVRAQIHRDSTNRRIIEIKKTCTLGFDAIWRGFHGMTTVENLALGIPTMVSADGNFEQVFKEFHKTDIFPFDRVNSIEEIKNQILYYCNNPEQLEHRSKEVRSFMETTWSYKNIANRIVQEYEKLLEK